jgi:hypothetical protein
LWQKNRILIEFFFTERDEKGYINSYPGERGGAVSRSGPLGKITYEIELPAEGMENFMMEPFIVTHVGKEGEVESRSHNGPERG